MLTRNVYFAERPENVIVTRFGNTYRCRVDLPVNIEEVETGEGETQWKADVYSVEAGWTPGMEERVEANYDAWMDVAQAIVVPDPTIQDVVEAINELAEFVLGGE